MCEITIVSLVSQYARLPTLVFSCALLTSTSEFLVQRDKTSSSRTESYCSKDAGPGGGIYGGDACSADFQDDYLIIPSGSFVQRLCVPGLMSDVTALLVKDEANLSFFKRSLIESVLWHRLRCQCRLDQQDHQDEQSHHF